MSKKINLATINESALQALSSFHVAYKAICEYSRQKKEALKKVDSELESYKSTHDKSEKDYVDKLAEFDRKKGAILNWYEDITKPLKEAQKPALSLVDVDVYYAYCVAMLKGNHSATGKLDISTKSEKKSYTVTKSYMRSVVEWLERMGCSALDNDTALKKVGQSLAIRCGGMMKDNKGEYLKLRNNSNFRSILVLAFLQYAIIDRKAIIVKADNTLVLNKGENTEA